MLITVFLIALIAFAGLVLTYLVAEDEPILWRISAGSVIGSAIFGTIAFVAADVFGLTVVTVAVSLILTFLPVTLLSLKNIRRRFLHDCAKAKGKLEGTTGAKFARFGYYLFFFLLLWLFFQQTMYETPAGIFTGGSQNLGDLPFHLGAIFSFTDGNNFPPQNPSWAGAKFTYPFIADFISACFVKLGADVPNAMFVPNLAWGFSLLVVLEKFVARVTNSKLAGRLAPALLFFSGGLGFLWFFRDYWDSGKGLMDFLWHLPQEYTIGDQFRWGNSLEVLFMTQRSLLFGMPLTVIVLGYLWKVFATEDTESTEESKKGRVSRLLPFPSSPLLIGLLAGTLPLIHLHSLVVLFVVTAFLFAMKFDQWRRWLAFGVGVAVIAVPELVWAMSGSATETSQFLGWHFGWDKGDANVLWFWIKNTGLVIPAVIAGVWIYFMQSRARNDAETPGPRDAAKKHKTADQVTASPLHGVALVYFYLPFAFLFVLSNVAKLAPWEWDNIKILIYWYVGSIPLMALAIVRLWEQKSWIKIAAPVCFAALVFSGALDVWRTASGQNRIKVFDRDAMQLAEQIKQKTAPNALFLNAPTYNSAVLLSGRRSLMRYSGHLMSHGIDYGPREKDVKQIYSGGGVADIFLRQYNIEYVLVSPEEKQSQQANEDAFKKYPVIAESGPYRVYKVKN